MKMFQGRVYKLQTAKINFSHVLAKNVCQWTCIGGYLGTGSSLGCTKILKKILVEKHKIDIFQMVTKNLFMNPSFIYFHI